MVENKIPFTLIRDIVQKRGSGIRFNEETMLSAFAAVQAEEVDQATLENIIIFQINFSGSEQKMIMRGQREILIDIAGNQVMLPAKKQCLCYP